MHVRRSRDFPDLAGVGNGRCVPHLPEAGKPSQIILLKNDEKKAKDFARIFVCEI